MKEALLVGDFYLEKKDFDSVKTFLEDLNSRYNVLINFEMSPLDQIANSKKIKLVADPKIIEDISRYHDFHFSIINNHIHDSTSEVQSLESRLSSLNIVNNFENLCAPINLFGEKFVFMGDRHEDVKINAPFNKFCANRIRQIDFSGSIVVVHGGLEYIHEPTYRQRYLAQLIIDRGGKAVIFHHSHVNCVHEYYHNKLIHYGLGNFIFSKIKGLHGIKLSNIGCVKISHSGTLIPGVIIDGKFHETQPTNFGSTEDYKTYYKTKYPIQSSFRPRQLYKSDLISDLMFFLWYFVAKLLVNLKISKKIKKFIDRIRG